ncbi:hypothetical protein AtNW77_MTg0322481 (mitochondrion) [Arabidopsis thaliana]
MSSLRQNWELFLNLKSTSTHTRAYRPLDESTVHRSARTALTSFFSSQKIWFINKLNRDHWGRLLSFDSSCL